MSKRSLLWIRLAGLLCAGLLFSGTSCAADYHASLASLPSLARVQVKLVEPQELKLYNVLTDFSNRRNLKLEGGAFTRSARPFHLVTIHVDPQTDFQVTNFRVPNIFELNVYSRENEAVWRPYWSELISDLSSSFGTNRIATVR